MIPRVMHTIWVGGPVPATHTAWRQTWVDLHPDWTHLHWGSFDWLTNQHLYDTAEQHTRSVGQFRADIARYEILFRHGGVYVDMDFQCVRPIDDLLDGVDCFAAWEVDGKWINNAICGATPGHPLFAELIAKLPGNVAANAGRRPNVMTGPHLLTKVARRHDLTVFPSRLFYPYLHSDVGTPREVGPFPDAYGIHHWANRRSRVA